jgi:ubiquitin carboxyl-terminal hydrolase 4/11/15
MMHVAPLTRYFLSDRYSADINNHNILGTGGKVANAYSAVLKDLWMGSHQCQNVSPTALKRAIELFAPQFSGASQQDSAELITYLLDALHEDLNRVKNPPYVEMPDVDLGRKLSISGAEVRKRKHPSAKKKPRCNILSHTLILFHSHEFIPCTGLATLLPS